MLRRLTRSWRWQCLSNGIDRYNASSLAQVTNNQRLAMNAIRIRKKIDSETLYLPELRPLVGKTVEIIVREEAAIPAGTDKTWQALAEAGAQDLVDPEVYKSYREFDRKNYLPPQS